MTPDGQVFPSVAGQLLVAMPSLTDPQFGGSVVFVAEHTPKGAMGLVINRVSEMTLGTLFSRLDLSLEGHPLEDTPVLLGGPVQTDRGFVLHEPKGSWSSTLAMTGSIGLTSSRDILEATANGKGPDRITVALGYSGWSEGQLDAELAANAWLTVPLHDHALLFSLPIEERLSAAFRSLGVDPVNLSGAVGHA
ncbi:COG1678 Putative transcriptional regulator [Burkholderiales bacterium]